MLLGLPKSMYYKLKQTLGQEGHSCSSLKALVKLENRPWKIMQIEKD